MPAKPLNQFANDHPWWFFLGISNQEKGFALGLFNAKHACACVTDDLIGWIMLLGWLLALPYRVFLLLSIIIIALIALFVSVVFNYQGLASFIYKLALTVEKDLKAYSG